MMLLVGWLVSRVYKYVAFSTLSDKACLAVVYICSLLHFSRLCILYCLSIFLHVQLLAIRKEGEQVNLLCVYVCKRKK